jgi:hypothetical protein
MSIGLFSDCSINDFNSKTDDELYLMYNAIDHSYNSTELLNIFGTNDNYIAKKEFNKCYLQKISSLNNGQTPDTTNIKTTLDTYSNLLETSQTADSVNENTISLYNNDLLYIIMKISLFIMLGVVYVIYIKNTNFLSALENIKNKTISFSQKIKDSATTITTKIKTSTQPLKQIPNPITNPIPSRNSVLSNTLNSSSK